jgi:hypothetical protein
MNKTLMLVICDFLLLSMLALARFDPPEEAPTATLDATASAASAEAELIALLEESLQAEQGSRENLSSDLRETRENLQEQARLLAEREARLENTTAALESTREDLEATSAKAETLAESQARIEAAKAELEAEQARLAERFESTRSELEKASRERIQLSDTLGQLKEARSVSEERLRQAEDALKQREIELARREAELLAAQDERERLAAERESLDRELRVSQAERELLASNLNQEQAEKEILRKEKEAAFARADQLTANVSQLGQGFTQLGENVTTLAASSAAMRDEMEAARPQTTSEIFTRFQNNRATIRFESTEAGLFSETRRNYESKSILITAPDGTTYLVTHSNNTPFALGRSSSPETARLTVSVGNGDLRINQIGFLAADPRLVFIPLPPAFVEATGLETFQLAQQPERWEEAVLVKSDESNFGSTGFRRLTSSARFLKMNRPALGELFADFAAARGDLAFTKNSRFIGLLTDTTHAVVIDDFVAAAVIEIGPGFNPESAQATLSRMRDRVRTLPAEVR